MNFRWKELTCNCCNQPAPLSRELLDFYNALQDFRDWYLLPMDLNCAYRCSSYNSSVGGHGRSNHLTGTAVDWSTRGKWTGMTDADVIKWCTHVVEKWQELGRKYGYAVEVELNRSWVHLAFNTNADIGQDRIGWANGLERVSSAFPPYMSSKAVTKIPNKLLKENL